MSFVLLAKLPFDIVEEIVKQMRRATVEAASTIGRILRGAQLRYRMTSRNTGIQSIFAMTRRDAEWARIMRGQDFQQSYRTLNLKFGLDKIRNYRPRRWTPEQISRVVRPIGPRAYMDDDI